MNLRQAREEKRITQAKLAEITGIPAPTISSFENGHRRPWPGAMRAIARALDYDVRGLFPDEVARREREVQDRLGLEGED